MRCNHPVYTQYTDDLSGRGPIEPISYHAKWPFRSNALTRIDIEPSFALRTATESNDAGPRHRENVHYARRKEALHRLFPENGTIQVQETRTIRIKVMTHSKMVRPEDH